MSDHLPGNPYGDATVENIAKFGEQVIALEGQTDATIIWQGICHLAGATMALAYEQRTANLMEYMHRWFDGDGDQANQLKNDLKKRLGRDTNE